MIRSFFVILITFAYILVLGTPVIIHALLSGNTDRLYWIGRWGARMALRLAGVRLEVRGLEKIPGRHGVVFMANHQSNCDPPALLSILPRVRVMVKKEFFRIPVLGRGMRLSGFIPVDRKNRERAVQAVDKAVESLQAGHSFLVFPEGTRSPDGRLQVLKKGVFVMAIRAAVPIVPISLSGSSKIMRKGKLAIRPGRVRITFHSPVPTKDCSMDERVRIMESVRRAILAGLAPDELPRDAAPESPRLPTATRTATSG